MKHIIWAAAAAIALLATPAFADGKLSEDEAKKAICRGSALAAKAAHGKRKPKPAAFTNSTMPSAKTAANTT